MTKQYVTTMVERKKIVSITCDWCGATISIGDLNHYGETIIETKISHSVGHSWPHDSYGEGWEVQDLCKDCGIRLNKLLKDNGINVHDYDW